MNKVKHLSKNGRCFSYLIGNCVIVNIPAAVLYQQHISLFVEGRLLLKKDSGIGLMKESPFNHINFLFSPHQFIVSAPQQWRLKRNLRRFRFAAGPIIRYPVQEV